MALEATRIIRAEMERRGTSYKRLAAALAARAGGEVESEQQLINKINRGRFSFAFVLRVCEAMGIANLNVARVESVVTRYSKLGE
jgi:hypothetical protein